MHHEQHDLCSTRKSYPSSPQHSRLCKEVCAAYIRENCSPVWTHLTHNLLRRYCAHTYSCLGIWFSGVQSSDCGTDLTHVASKSGSRRTTGALRPRRDYQDPHFAQIHRKDCHPQPPYDPFGTTNPSSVSGMTRKKDSWTVSLVFHRFLRRPHFFQVYGHLAMKRPHDASRRGFTNTASTTPLGIWHAKYLVGVLNKVKLVFILLTSSSLLR